jgi:predicted membrane protein
MNYSNNNPGTGKHHCQKNDGLPVIGIFLVGLGLVFLLDRLHIIPHHLRSLIISWQALLIFIGFTNLFRAKSRFPGVVLILIGSAFLIPDAINIPFETRQRIWPIVLITVGLAIVFKARKFKHPEIFHAHDTTINDSEKIDEVAIFGGGKRVISSKNLKGGNITAIFGGLEIDLTDAEIGGDTAVIEVSAIFGGATVIVRPDWDVQVQVTSILGGFSDERKIYKGDVNPNAKRLIIKGAAIFGGGEVKSY